MTQPSGHSGKPTEAVITSKVDRLVTLLEQALRNGQFVAGDRFLSSYEIARDYGVSAGTARKAMGELVRKGYLQTSERSGFFLRQAGADLSREMASVPAPLAAPAAAPDALLVLTGHVEEGGRQVFADYIAALRHGASRHGWQVVEASNHADQIAEALHRHRVIGCLAYGLREAPAGDIDLTSTVLWNRANDWRHRDCTLMGLDTDTAARLAFEHLWDLGHSKTALVRWHAVNGPTANTTGMILGMRKAYYSVGTPWTPDEVILVTPESLPTLYDTIRAAGVTGICCGDWDVISELYQQAERRGHEIGERLSIVTVGGHDQLHTLHPAPARICWRAVDYASVVVRALAQRVDGLPMPRHVHLPVFLDEGRSARQVFESKYSAADTVKA